MKKKKKFFETTVGRVLKGAASIVAPGLVGALEGVNTVGDAIQVIRGSTEISEETKLELEKLALDQYRAEVDDRISARQREAIVASSGGSDILFKTVGWGITACFIAVNAASFGAFGEIPEDLLRAFDRSYGAVNALMVMVVSYYFGSSYGSKQKTALMSNT